MVNSGLVASVEIKNFHQSVLSHELSFKARVRNSPSKQYKGNSELKFLFIFIFRFLEQFLWIL